MILTDEELRAITSGALWSDADCHADLCAQVARATERAVLEKLREPTREMLDAGRNAQRLTPGNCLGLEYVAPDGAWRAMIDAATKAG